ncbi:MAG TPA: histidine ammonia-lyase, partial [Promineifilum sp.]|nr:histidine ammonia-lyase [Promineifilum sp.]
EHVETIVGIELMLAAQGIDFRAREMGLTPAELGEGTAVAYHLIREHIPFLTGDVYLSPLIEQARALVASGNIKAAVEKALGMD